MYVIADSSSRFTVHKSVDGGVHWNRIGDPITWGNVLSMGVTPSGSVILRIEYALYTNDTTFNVTSVSQGGELNPENLRLGQNYPNPFNPTTTFQFSIVNSQLTIVKVYDLLGREVATLVNEVKGPGVYTARFDASSLTSGIYFYRLRTPEFVETKKMLLLR